MDTGKLQASLSKIKSINRNLDLINSGETNVEVRFFTDGWTTISFNPKSKAIFNMVIHQVRMELESDLKEEKSNLKHLTQNE